MTEYIDRDYVLSLMLDELPEPGENPDADRLYNIVLNAPGVDIVQSMHKGTWVFDEGGAAYCSECGTSPAYWEQTPDNPYGLPPHCHGCGSKMALVEYVPGTDFTEEDWLE